MAAADDGCHDNGRSLHQRTLQVSATSQCRRKARGPYVGYDDDDNDDDDDVIGMTRMTGSDHQRNT